MNTNTIALAQLKVSGCSAELSLNGIPLIRLAPPQMPIQNIAVEQYLIPGINTLEILVEPGSRPTLDRSEQRMLAFRPMEAVGRLIRFPEGVPGTVEHGELLGEVRFSWSDANIRQLLFPWSGATRIDMGPAHGRFGWQDAPRLVLDTATLEEVYRLLDDIEEAIRTFDEERLWRLTEHQRGDLVRAYPAINEARLRQQLAELLGHQRNVSEPVIPRNPSRHDFRIVAEGRMLQCIGADWKSSIRLRNPGDGSELTYPLFLARLGTTLQIVR
jgi:hypothetical protein